MDAVSLSVYTSKKDKESMYAHNGADSVEVNHVYRQSENFCTVRTRRRRHEQFPP